MVLGLLLAGGFLRLSLATGAGADWPTYQNDAARSGATAERLHLPLAPAWIYTARQPPHPAWPPPAKQDFWHRLGDLKPTVIYDRAFHTVVAGDTVFFGSSSDDTVYALDSATGARRWTFSADGPVRLAPTVARGKVYVGSDDGWVYCLCEADGALVWKYRPPHDERRIPGNGRIISPVPVRTGVLVHEGVAFFGAGLFPSEAVFICALNAATGSPLWVQKAEDISPQGYLLATPSRLFVPTGRDSPAMFDRRTGAYLGMLAGQGGAYAVVVENTLMSGPGRASGNELSIADTTTRESVASFPGLRMVLKGDMAYLLSRQELAALKRTRYVDLARRRNVVRDRLQKAEELLKKARATNETAAQDRLRDEVGSLKASIVELTGQLGACYQWTRPVACPHALILAGDLLVAGGDGMVSAFDVRTGSPRWTGHVAGRAYGLSAAHGRLFVSTDRGSIYCFAPRTGQKPVVRTTPVQPPYADDELTSIYQEAARHILHTSTIQRGYCVVLDAGVGRLAYEIAQHSNLAVVGVEGSRTAVAAARNALRRTGLYGDRITIHHWQGGKLPFTSYLANLVVSDRLLVGGALSAPPREVYRILRPHGGVACLGRSTRAAAAVGTLDPTRLHRWLDHGELRHGIVSRENGVWAILRRGAVPGEGAWTQLYATANHTASSMDELRGPLVIQWFGAPGPRRMIDRHHRPMSSLVSDGRLFIPADERIMAVDAYNGTALWELAVPGSRRVGALKNAGHMLVAEDLLYIVVQDECWAIDVTDGTKRSSVKAPQPFSTAHQWGYLNCAGTRLFGTLQRTGASYTKINRAMIDFFEGDLRPVVISRALFAVDRFTERTPWIYRHGALMNSAIAIDRGRIYFVESRNERALEDEDGRLRVDTFCAGNTHLTALDLETGQVVWQRPVQLPFQHIMFVNGAENTLLVSGSYNKGRMVYYALIAFHMDTGEERWETAYRAVNIRTTGPADVGGTHGEQVQHPVIVGRTVYSRPYAFDLHTGKKSTYVLQRGGHGCGGLTASAHYLYGRGGTPRMYPTDVARTEGVRLTRVSRPGCWLNIIPAGGMVVIPESSSGCTCAYPLQTSIGLIPKAAAGATTFREHHKP